jgi:hypothetical protein
MVGPTPIYGVAGPEGRWEAEQMRRIAIACCLLLGSGAAAIEKGDPVEPPSIVRAKTAVLRTLQVPDVAVFENLSTKIAKDAKGERWSVVCGLLNTFGNGGFVGFQPFAFLVATSDAIIVSADTPPERKEFVRLLCSEVFTK